MTKLAGRYQIIRELGGGTFAVTYLAQDDMQPSKPFCVVKQLRPIYTDAQVLGLFEKEAVILEKLGKHPQIPTLLAHFQENDKFYIIQEYIDGHDLSKEIFAGKRLSEGYVIKLLQDILEALAFVHTQGVIHRDIKPANLMRRKEDGKICLVDFGAVKQIGSIILNPQGGITPSIIIGSPGYMPGEQGIGQPCYASDIYAVGMTAIHALTGINPTHLQEDPPTGEIIWPYDQLQISEYLAEVLTTMVRRYFKMRYPSALEALAALKPLLEASTGTILFTPAKTAYCNEVLKRLKQGNGKLSPVALQLLETERKKLSLSSAEAKEMYEFAFSQAQEYARKLNEYEDLFFKVVKVQFPFNQETEAELQEYRDSLGLKPEDVANIEERVLAQRQLEYERQPKKPNPPPPQPERFIGIPVTTFEFETAKLILKSGVFGLGKGWEIQRSRKKARLFIQNLGNGVNLEMVAIPGGTFFMGSPENEESRSSSDSPQHQVNVPPFFMGKYPVTQKQWQAIAALPKVKIDLESDPSNFKGDNLPVERVSWDSVQEFCARLSQRTSKAYRLPSEAEWEYACRAGTTTPFYFGETISTDLANYNGNYTYGSGVKGEYREKTTDVGKFPANAFGLYDMCGNIWEWCEDEWHENYIDAPTDGSAWLDGSNNNTRMLRGGSWDFDPWFCRSALRLGSWRGARYSHLGFRLAVSPPRIL
ncbi:bifunctional serine/threonine-protein kinase/formylglycine-generating enzyme family protein [Anabaena sp. PCC 7108]|uniref:bifunctional serine/threonine-protein kinase/formylglycine-generating enzyme family protein n=1 Tax=Anabaena sp. PCC 7108 TaxID=163908 RepID=UPI0003731A5C|nr:bifunctional serine/threonine-protein kinase/formylglycine-generating enzyme family protein [Anabaena sp. PCC 7108]